MESPYSESQRHYQNWIICEIYASSGLKAPTLMFVFLPGDKDGMLDLPQAGFVGTEVSINAMRTVLVGTDRMRPRLIFGEVMRRTQLNMTVAVRKAMRKAVARNGGRPPIGGSVFGAIAYAVGVGVATVADGVSEAF